MLIAGSYIPTITPAVLQDRISRTSCLSPAPKLVLKGPISVLPGRNSFTWDPPFLGRTIFFLAGQKTRLDFSPPDQIPASRVL